MPHTFIDCAKIKPGNSISRQTYFEISGLQRYFEERLPSRLGLPVFFLLKNPPTSNPASNMLLGFKTTCETVPLSKMLISVCNTWCSGSLCLIYLRNRWPVVLLRACFSKFQNGFRASLKKSIFWRIFLSWRRFWFHLVSNNKFYEWWTNPAYLAPAVKHPAYLPVL